eukprot:2498176-Amphidinium_carterae.7
MKLLPLAGFSEGIADNPWAHAWLHARKLQGLVASDSEQEATMPVLGLGLAACRPNRSYHHQQQLHGSLRC